MVLQRYFDSKEWRFRGVFSHLPMWMFGVLKRTAHSRVPLGQMAVEYLWLELPVRFECSLDKPFED